MFVFDEQDIPLIIDVCSSIFRYPCIFLEQTILTTQAVITEMLPKIGKSKRQIPCNLIFFGARYACYYNSTEMLEKWMTSVCEGLRSAIVCFIIIFISPP